MSSDKDQGIEYSIYAFEAAGTGGGQKHGIVRDRAGALSAAEKLAKSGKYKKVEVIQRYFDKNNNRKIEVTLKTFKGSKKKEMDVALAFIFAVLCGTAAFALTWFLTK